MNIELEPPDKLERFILAFSNGHGSCRQTCDCGVEWYDWRGSYDWTEGELEKLQANPKARGLDYCVSMAGFEGRTFVMDCTCWHARASQIIRWIESHDHKIADYLNGEKKHAEAQAKLMPTVSIGS